MKSPFTFRNLAFATLCSLALMPASLLAETTGKNVEERGTIKSVDSIAHQLIVINQKSKHAGTFQWNDQTKFAEHDKAVSATALKEGQLVHLTFAPGSGTRTLERVQISTAKEHKPAAAAPTTHRKS